MVNWIFLVPRDLFSTPKPIRNLDGLIDAHQSFHGEP